ncbi:hypothetical protein BHE74_00046436 [Ensete ventricosum]|uniref:Uncharacterized protein n=1 Tax=Ensete ventricosum TaxID=4639 RepID=A0A445MGA3_ENSVE|nr:hypothetical protein BHE74_00046436 [Ensete ventricosum]RZR73226.1 hypothetical protein BHM03_00021663 [Ensete ventricosum]
MAINWKHQGNKFKQCCCFIGLQDFSQQPPAQELIARDLHDVEWKFRHIYRGKLFHSLISFPGPNILRATPSEFVIPLSKYLKAVFHTRVSVGMRFRMLFETEECSVRR